MLNLPILPILIALPLVGLAFVLLSPEGDDFAKESKKFLNLEDNNEYDGLDRSTIPESKLNLDFGDNYDISN